jgi:hypothetical protein
MEKPSYNIKYANEVSEHEFVKNHKGTGFSDAELKQHWKELQVKPKK